MFRITPKPGLIIRNPEHRGDIVPPEGITVSKLSPFWRRRLRDESVSLLEIPSISAPAPAPLSREEI